MESNDCKVCKRLMKEKKQRDIWWKVGCIVFCAFTIILGILYFTSGSITKETNIKINNSFNETDSKGGNILVGSDENAVGNEFNGTINEKDYTPIICITIIAGVAVLVAGGVLIADYVKRNNQY